MEHRPITTVDLEACADVFYAADDDLQVQRGLPISPRNRPALLRLFAHVSASSPHRAWLAEQRGEIVGFGMAAQRDDLTFLSFLFVLPEVQSRGVGRALLERCMAGSTNRAVCIFSVQPVSAALYARYGMVPLDPLYTFIGRPATELPALPTGTRVGPIEPAATSALDLEVAGFSRPVDHAAWAAWGRTLIGLFDGDEPVGYGYAQASGRFGPVMVRRAELLLPFVGQLMREIEPIEEWMLHVPGAAGETFEALLRAGLRLDGPPIIYCANRRLSDHSRYLPATYALP